MNKTDESVKLARVIRAERKALQCADNEELSALCLSGGGIRSATFGLGVIQGLAGLGRLEKFHYLSAVSGGGYIAGWLSAWFTREKSTKKVVAELATSAQQQTMLDPNKSHEPQPIRRLRAYSNFLTPTWGVSADSLAIVGIFLRNLLLHWSVVLPLFAALFLLPWLVRAAMGSSANVGWTVAFFAVVISAVCSTLVVPLASSMGPDPTVHVAPSKQNEAVFRWIQAAYFLAVLSTVFAMTLAPSVLPAWLRVPFVAPKFWASQQWLVISMWFCGAQMLGNILASLLTLSGKIRARCGFERPSWSVFFRRLFFSAIAGAVAGLMLGWYLRTAQSWGLSDLSKTVFSPVAALGAFWLGTVIRTGLGRRWTTELVREWWARATGTLLAAGIAWAILAYGLLVVPEQILQLKALQQNWTAGTVGIGGALVAALTAGYGFWSQNGAELKQHAMAFSEALGLRALEIAAFCTLLGFALVMNFALAYLLHSLGHPDATPCGRIFADGFGSACDSQMLISAATQADTPAAGSILQVWAQAFQLTRDCTSALLVGWVIIVCLFVATVLSCFLGANPFSMAALYGNRLTRAYLGASNKDKLGRDCYTGLNPSDNLALAPIKRSKSARKPLLILGAALNLIRRSGDRLEWQERQASSFTMSPLFCGSVETGFVKTSQYSDTNGVHEPGLTLGRAIAISGAAVSPSMGYHSSVLVTMVMALFNLRLGWWLPHPGKPDSIKRSEPIFGIGPVFAELTSSVDDSHRFVNISDGGHFENLGLYEMVRRRCKRIVVVDCGADPTYEFEDLENAIRKIRVDLGVDIELNPQIVTPAFAARARANNESGRRHVVGRIRYAKQDSDQDGILVYVKPLLLGDEPIDIARYAKSSKKNGSAFPQQSTADQFFDEAQFESYRKLGQLTIEAVFDPAAFSSPTKWPAPDSFPAAAVIRETELAEIASKAKPAKSFFNSINTLAQTALIASAISVTGVIGLNVVAKLENPTVKLDAEGARVSLVVPEEIAVISTTLTEINRNGVAIDASRSIASLIEVINQFDGGGLTSAQIETLITAFKRIVFKVEILKGGDLDGVDLTRLSSIFSTLSNELNQISAAINNSTTSINGARIALTTQLNELKIVMSTLPKILAHVELNNDQQRQLGEIVDHINRISAAITPAGGSDGGSENLYKKVENITDEVRNLGPESHVNGGGK